MPTSFNGGTDVSFSFSYNEGSPPMVTYKDGGSSATRYTGFISIPDVCFLFSFNVGSRFMVTYKDVASTTTRFTGFASMPTSFISETDVCFPCCFN